MRKQKWYGFLIDTIDSVNHFKDYLRHNKGILYRPTKCMNVIHILAQDKDATVAAAKELNIDWQWTNPY